MILYVLVEGRRTEKQIYRGWLQHCFPELKIAETVEELNDGCAYLLSGNGYPSYRDRIFHSLDDIRQHGAVDWFLVCVDSEEWTFEEKITELKRLAAERAPFHGTRFVIQTCCIETWLLGHQKIVKRNPESEQLQTCLGFYDVVTDDPEKMLAKQGFATRAQFHEAYLKWVFRERGQSYSKTRPGCACEAHYLREIVRRRDATGHLDSFGKFLDVLGEMGVARAKLRHEA